MFESGLQFKRFIKSRINTMREHDQSSQAVKFKGLLIHTYLQAAALTVTRQERVNPSPASTKFFPLGPSTDFSPGASQDLSEPMIALSGASKVSSEEPFSMISQGAAFQAVLETASFFPTCPNSHRWCTFYNSSFEDLKKKTTSPTSNTSLAIRCCSSFAMCVPYLNGPIF